MLNKIKELCKERGIQNLNELEAMSGIGRNTIYRWDEASPSVDRAAKVAAVLGCTVDELLRGDEEDR